MMKPHRRPVLRISLALALACIASCRPGPDVEKKASRLRIAVLLDSARPPIRNTQLQMLQRLAQNRAGAELLIWDAGGNSQTQENQLVEALVEQPGCLFIFPADPASTSAALNLNRRPLPRTFIFGEAKTDSPNCSVIICPAGDTGRVAGEFVLDSLRKKAEEEGRAEPSGRIVELTSLPSTAAGSEVSAAFFKVISAQPEVLLVHQAPCGIAGEDVSARLQEALRLQKDFNVIFAHNDLIAQAASKAITAINPDLRDRILILGVDGSLGKGGGNELVIQGVIDGTLYQPPLVDFAWTLMEKCLDDPAFQPNPRYELKPKAVNVERALDAARKGNPRPALE